MLRAYDNRVRQTSQSPYLYQNFAKIKDNTKSIIKWTEENGDQETIEFRDSTYLQHLTIFRSDGMCGKVEVIAVPFNPGTHVCSTVKEA